jgi:hypothetical protein
MKASMREKCQLESSLSPREHDRFIVEINVGILDLVTSPFSLFEF